MVRIPPMPTKKAPAVDFTEQLEAVPVNVALPLPSEGFEYAAPDPVAEPDPSGAPAPLTGEALLAFFNSNRESLSVNEIARRSGYVTLATRNGVTQERVMMSRFNAALLFAQGIDTGTGSSGTGRSHAGKTQARISGSGILLVSQLATREVDGSPGDVYSVTYPGERQILLTPTGENRPVEPRNKVATEEPGTPLLDGLSLSGEADE
jgi:hypothetical protein